MKSLLWKAFIVWLVFICSSAAAEPRVLRANDSSDPNGPYAVSMINLALSYLDNQYTLNVDKEKLAGARVIEDLNSGRLDIIWGSSNAEKEGQMLPIRIPLYKGLLGYRIFIIRKDNQHKFDQINTFDDLKRLSFGQGKTWADTEILEANGLNIVKVSKYPSLFYMVEGDRFDAFPRGVHEPFGEIASHPNMNLAVEEKLMLVYRMPFYLFVNKKDHALAAALEDALNQAIADGSFDRLFLSAPAVQDVIKKANMKNRKIFELNNPTLHKDTPLGRKELWFDPASL